MPKVKIIWTDTTQIEGCYECGSNYFNLFKDAQDTFEEISEEDLDSLRKNLYAIAKHPKYYDYKPHLIVLDDTPISIQLGKIGDIVAKYKKSVEESLKKAKAKKKEQKKKTKERKMQQYLKLKEELEGKDK